MSSLLPLVFLLLAAPAAEKGALQLVSQPGVEVEWEGILLGETDAKGLLTIRDIPPGEYRIALRKRGFRPLTRRLTVEPGDNVVSLRLEALPAPPKPAPRPAPKAGIPAVAERPRAEDEAPVPSPEPAAPAEAETSAAAAEDEPVPREASAGATVPASDGGSWPTVFAFLVMSAAMVAAAGLAVRRSRGRRRKRAVGSRHPSSSKRKSSRRQRPARDAAAGTPEFLKDLQRREERVAAAIRYRDGREVIEITEVEVLDAETDGGDADGDADEELEH